LCKEHLNFDHKHINYVQHLECGGYLARETTPGGSGVRDTLLQMPVYSVEPWPSNFTHLQHISSSVEDYTIVVSLSPIIGLIASCIYLNFVSDHLSINSVTLHSLINVVNEIVHRGILMMYFKHLINYDLCDTNHY